MLLSGLLDFHRRKQMAVQEYIQLQQPDIFFQEHIQHALRPSTCYNKIYLYGLLTSILLSQTDWKTPKTRKPEKQKAYTEP